MNTKFLFLNQPLNFKVIFLLVCNLTLLQVSYAQISNADVVTGPDAAARKEAFHNRFGAPSRPTTRSISFKVSELQAILDEYKAAGVSEIVFVPSLIRNGDDANRFAAKIAAKKPGVSAGMVANRFTLLVKAPQNGSASLKRLFNQDRYYDIAMICPPPDNCIE